MSNAMAGQRPAPNPWDHCVLLETIPEDGLLVCLKAGAEARRTIADRFAWISVKALNAKVSLTLRGGHLLLSGTIRATVVQPCVATLEPVQSDLTLPVNIRFMPQEDLEIREARDEEDGAVLIDADSAAEDLDLLPEHSLELGDTLAQILALAVPAFPRKTDVSWQDRDFGGEEDGKSNPFAVLATLKDKPS